MEKDVKIPQCELLRPLSLSKRTQKSDNEIAMSKISCISIICFSIFSAKIVARPPDNVVAKKLSPPNALQPPAERKNSPLPELRELYQVVSSIHKCLPHIFQNRHTVVFLFHALFFESARYCQPANIGVWTF